LYDEFLSEAECDGLMKAHNKHVQELSKIDPLLCFDSIQTLRRHLQAVGKKVKVTPRDFIPGLFRLFDILLIQYSSYTDLLDFMF